MKRTRTDTTTGAVEAAQAASLGPIKPPAHLSLRDDDWPYWNAVISARALVDWTDADLAFAVNLARCQCDIMRIQIELEVEGDTVKNQRGTPIVNPKHSLVETLTRRAASLSAKLHVHALATTGRSADAAGRLGAQEAAAQADNGDDELIPRLRSVK